MTTTNRNGVVHLNVFLIFSTKSAAMSIASLHPVGKIAVDIIKKP